MFTLGVIPQDTINNDSDDIMIFFIVGFNFTAIYWKVKKKSVKSSMRYTNAPVYIEPQFNPVTGINNYLMSSSVDVQYSTSLTPKRTIGYPVDLDRQYPVSGPSETKINISFYLHKDTPSTAYPSVNSDDAYSFLYDSIPNLTSGDLGSQTGNADFVIKIGDNIFKKCYLDQYQIQVNPFQPLQASAEFTSYDFPSEESISGDSTIQSNIDSAMKATGIMDGAHCVLSGANQVVSADVVTSFAYTKKYSRTPIYGIGSVNPVRYLIDEVAAEVAIQSTGLNSFIDYSGKKLTSSISLIPKDVNGNHIDAFGGGQLSFALSSGATLYQEKYSVQEGNSSATSVSIQEIIV